MECEDAATSGKEMGIKMEKREAEAESEVSDTRQMEAYAWPAAHLKRCSMRTMTSALSPQCSRFHRRTRDTEYLRAFVARSQTGSYMDEWDPMDDRPLPSRLPVTGTHRIMQCSSSFGRFGFNSAFFHQPPFYLVYHEHQKGFWGFSIPILARHFRR